MDSTYTRLDKKMLLIKFMFSTSRSHEKQQSVMINAEAQQIDILAYQSIQGTKKVVLLRYNLKVTGHKLLYSS